ncbi:MAG: ribosome-associated translation inhibitor RaiA [Chloroflexi bacterium]|nr:ribosome-associated translation inhibitor RaiA [Chloroflexota bacterium]
MDIKIYAKNISVNPSAENYIQKKYNRLERHLNSITDAKLEIERTSARSQADRVTAQMTITANGYTLRGQESGVNLFAAIDNVADVMDRQIQRYKGKVYRSEQGKKSARTALAADTATPPAQDEVPDEATLPEMGRVVKTKRFPMKPMTVEDAILEMELLGHGFFLFYNIDTSDYNVVYRRNDGDYGVIVPLMS